MTFENNEKLNVPQIWKEMRNTKNFIGNYLTRSILITPYLEIRTVLDKENRVGLLIISKSFALQKKAFESFDLKTNITKNKKKIILLMLKYEELEDVFSSFFNILIQEGKNWNTENGARFLEKQLKKWNDLVRLKGNKFTEEKEIALFAEILTLQDLIKAKSTSVLTNWLGPEGGKQDFQFADYSIEVKATINDKASIKISSLDQLDLHPKVFMCLYRFEKKESGITLLELVNATEKMIKDENHLNCLRMKIGLYGFNKTIGNIGSDTKWNIISQTWYDTSADLFPALRRSQLPPAILKAQYELSNFNLKDYEIVKPF